MNNKGQINSKELQIQGLLDHYLQANSQNKSFENKSEHLDEDSLAAFVDGNLLEGEAKPIINHLANCSYCRHISSELIKLDLVFAEEPAPVGQLAAEPTKVSEVLSGVLSRIFGSADEAVFAHNEDEKNPEDVTEEEESDT